MTMVSTDNLLAVGDYPAAHSMDTTWYAVDENGEIGAFDSGSQGVVPQLEGQKPVVAEKGESHFYRPNYYDEYDEVGEHLPKERAHAYSCEHSVNLGYYTWDRSPEQPLTIDEVPEEFRNARYLVFLKGYRFSSREPVNPYDHGPCYNWGDFEYFPDTGFATRFPTPGHDRPWSIESFTDLYAGDHELNRVFFAIDDDGCLALFRTDYFGAIPAGSQGVEGDLVWVEIAKAGPEAFGVPYRIEELGPPTPVEQIYDFKNDGWLDGPPWVFLLHANTTPHGRVRFTRTDKGLVATFAEEFTHRWFEEAIKAGRVIGVWREWPRHWLEYPFGPASPRMWGIFHYDASWIYPIPYLRIAAPPDPIKADKLSAKWIERMNPVRLPGVRFKGAARVQPFEFVSCVVDPGDTDILHLPDHWIDSRLERMHPCHEFSLKPRDEEYVLSQARKHVAFVEKLAR